MIYEAPAEGGINRLMPVFEDYSGLDRIGSLRSARTYFCFFSKEFDAVLGLSLIHILYPQNIRQISSANLMFL